MKLFDRDIARYIKRLPEIPDYIGYVFKCLFLFKRPLPILKAYLSGTSLPERLIELRNGLKVYLSEHPHDIVTVFLVFVREDYGQVEPGSTVVDIGANIGIYSLYAACGKARRVMAYEPNSQAFHQLAKNIEANHLERVIEPYQYAVTGLKGDRVRFPLKSSMYNAILPETSGEEYELVETIDLPTILGELEQADLVKMDCEGAEYTILLEAGPDVCRKIKEIRMEYHWGREREIEAHLTAHGFVKRRYRADTAESGDVWYQRIG
jgi:FkbM family methyltransferase